MLTPSRRQFAWTLAAAASLIGLLGLHAAEPTTRPATAPVAERVADELRGAQAARRELLEAEQDWAMEKERLELLRSTVEARAERLRERAEAARTEQAGLERASAEARGAVDRLTRVEAMIASLADRLEAALADLARRNLPGVVPPPGDASAAGGPAERLAAAAERLARAGDRAGRGGVEIVTGSLGGEPLTVKLLRAGSAAAWWCSLDGKRCGQAILRNGELVLRPTPTPADAEAIGRAFAIAEGLAAPAWVLLPTAHVEPAPDDPEADRP
jgi:hypothetical protein